jgi:hypothetical protein
MLPAACANCRWAPGQPAVRIARLMVDIERRSLGRAAARRPAHGPLPAEQPPPTSPLPHESCSRPPAHPSGDGPGLWRSRQAMIVQTCTASTTTQPAEGGLDDHSTRRTTERRMTAITAMRDPLRGPAMTSSSWTLARGRARAPRRESTPTSCSFGASYGQGQRPLKMNSLVFSSMWSIASAMYVFIRRSRSRCAWATSTPT